jgi:hypothetical protein
MFYTFVQVLCSGNHFHVNTMFVSYLVEHTRDCPFVRIKFDYCVILMLARCLLYLSISLCCTVLVLNREYYQALD